MTPVRSRLGHSGSGPGPIAPDGSPVELYRVLPPSKQPALVHASIPAGSDILELGCGIGRVTHELLARGHRVVAVDESPEMLAYVRADSVCTAIEDLRLADRFDVVLLTSYLINTPDPDLRRRFLDTCRFHLRPAGSVIIERQDSSYLARPYVAERGDTRFELRDIQRRGRGVVTATLEYRIGGHVWTQVVTTQDLDDDELERSLGESSLLIAGYLTGDRTWIRATAA